MGSSLLELSLVTEVLVGTILHSPTLLMLALVGAIFALSPYLASDACFTPILSYGPTPPNPMSKCALAQHS